MKAVATTSTILNLQRNNALLDEQNDLSENVQPIHVRIQQRNGKKSITTIEDLAPDLSLTKMVQAMKREFHCGGRIQRDPVSRKRNIQLTGDQRKLVQAFLIREEIIDKDQILVHGF